MRLTFLLVIAASLALASCARGSMSNDQMRPSENITTQESEVETLNQMVSILIDANTLYHEAANIPDEPGVAPLIREIADKRDRQREDLQMLVMKIGASPDTYGEALGTAHRSWTQARTAMESDTKVAIQEVLRGEYYILKIVDVCQKEPLSDKSSEWLDTLTDDVDVDIDRLQSLLVEKGFDRFKKPK